MNHNFLRAVTTLLLMSLMLIPTVFAASLDANFDAFPEEKETATISIANTSRVVTIGSIDPSLGYDEIVNGTTTFRVPRNRPGEHGTFYHNITKVEYKVSRVEETPFSYYDNSTGKCYRDTLIAEPYESSVPDPSGKVTVFSNEIFHKTGQTKTKKILHPDGISQSVLHVSGQAIDDPFARYLKVSIYNSKYPSGYTVDYTVVQTSFDKSYDVTNMVVGRDVNTVEITLTTDEGRWNVQSYFWVSTVGTDVYIVMIPDVPTWWVSDIDAVRRGVEDACIVTPLVHRSDWKGLTYLEVVDMPTYQYIIENPYNVRPPGFYGETGIIVVNAHGEVFPVPSGVGWGSWVDKISLAVQTKGLTWVQVAGYPFHYYSSGSNVKTEVGSSGFQRFLQRILGTNSIDCWPNQEGIAVSLQGGYSNRLWGYGLVSGTLHEGRPLKISSSTNLADLLDVMGYRSGGVEYLTLGLVGFASPNQVVAPDQQVGYYVHNGAQEYDNDHNKGKYSMAVAAWTKISILASGWIGVYYEGNYLGKVKGQVAWSYAVPPATSGDTWKVRFVTETIAHLWYTWGGGVLVDANAPLKISRSSSGTKFQFIKYQSTTLYDLSENSWQNTIARGVLFTTISVILAPFAMPLEVAVAVAIGLGFTETVTELAFESPSPVEGPDYVDLALKDFSDVTMEDANGNDYRQLQSFGVTEVSLAQSPNGGASETLTFKLGQKGGYLSLGDYKIYWAKGILTLGVSAVVEPYLSADANNPPNPPSTPSGPTSGYMGPTYTYYTSATDPNGDDVRYEFDWGDGTTTTGWRASGSIVTASHSWGSPGTYYVKVRAQDPTGAWSGDSSLTVTVVEKKIAGCWRFNEGGDSTAGDGSGFGNHGTIYGATWTTGWIGYGLSFDGVDDYVTVPNAPSLKMKDAITVMAWVKPENPNANDRNKAVFRDGTFNFQPGYHYATRDFRFEVHIEGVGWVGLVTNNYAVDWGVWQHFTCTYDGSYMRIYKNGQLIKSKPQTGKIWGMDTTLQMGCSWIGQSYYKGVMDEVRIYNCALPAEEIKQIADGNVYYFSSNSLTIVIDSTAHNDPYPRGHAVTVDNPIPKVFWKGAWYEANKDVYRVAGGSFHWEKTYYLSSGRHVLEYAVGCYVNHWDATIKINGVVVAEEETNVDNHVYVEFYISGT